MTENETGRANTASAPPSRAIRARSQVAKKEGLPRWVKAVERTSRNIFAVVDRDDNTFLGIIKLDNIRNIMFKPEYYDKVFVRDLVFRPDYTVRIDESMESVVTKFSHSDKYNIAVLDQNNKYLGFVSRARIFSIYRRMSRQLSEE